MADPPVPRVYRGDKNRRGEPRANRGDTANSFSSHEK
jgi:hypothetical protein